MQEPEIRAVHTVGHGTAPSVPVPFWLIESTDSAGDNHALGFPLDTMSIRAAEYNLPFGTYEERNLIVDILLHEPFVGNTLVPGKLEDDPALKAGIYVKAKQRGFGIEIGQKIPVDLYTADTIEQALEAHLIRIAEAKKTTQMLSVLSVPQEQRRGLALTADTKVCPLDKLRHDEIDPKKLDMHRERVHVYRESLRKGEIPPPVMHRTEAEKMAGKQRPRPPMDDSSMLRLKAVRKETELL